MNLGIANRIVVEDADTKDTVDDLDMWVEDDTPTIPNPPSYYEGAPSHTSIVLLQQQASDDSLFAVAAEDLAQYYRNRHDLIADAAEVSQ